MVFTLITTALLIEDLKKPMVFYRLLTRPNMKSWLVKGGMILGAFGAACVAVVLLRMLRMDSMADGLRWAEALLGVGAAGYTAFLFGQCEGRDLWQSKWLLPSLLAQAVMCGGIVLAPFSETPKYCGITGAAGMLAFGVIAFLERLGKHSTTNASQAAAFLGTLRVGPIKAWHGGLAIILVGFAAGHFVPVIAFVPVLVGLYLYEWAYVRAAQLPPLS
jgi:hypothetical protein